jgi:hypothetical protein
VKRTTPLRSNPAKTVAFLARGRAKGLRRTNRPPVARSTLKRSQRLKRARPTARVTTPAAVWAAVLKRDGGLCVWSRHLGREVRAEHPHHLLARSIWPQYNGTRQAIVSLAAQPHMQHEHSPNDRLPWAALPAECQAFLRQVAAEDARAARFVRVKYPGSPL